MKAYLVAVNGCDGVVVAADNLMKAMAKAVEWANEEDGSATLEDIESVQCLSDYFVVAI